MSLVDLATNVKNKYQYTTLVDCKVFPNADGSEAIVLVFKNPTGEFSNWVLQPTVNPTTIGGCTVQVNSGLASRYSNWVAEDSNS